MRNQIPLINNLKILEKLEPQMRYDKNEDFDQWQSRARKKLESLLGLPYEKADLDLKIEFEKELEEFTQIRFTFQSEPGYYVPCNLLIPKGATTPKPVMICLQGHSKGMHISMGEVIYEGDDVTASGGDRDFAIRTIREGYCALTIEQRNFGECGGNENGPQCHISTMTALLMGRTTIGERVWDISRAIDVLEQNFPAVDSEKIYCMGNSGGGTATFYAACMEERIKAAMPSCAVCSFDGSIAPIRHCVCNFIPNIRKYFDMGDLGGLIAPRPLVMVTGELDNIFPLDYATKTFETIKELYAQKGAEEKCTLVVGKGGHRFYADDGWKAFKEIISK